MFSKIKKSIKRTFLFILFLGVIVLVVMTTTNLFGDRLFAPEAIKIWIDADSGNEIDDLYAISRALIAPELEVIGISSSHWEFHPDANGRSLEISQELNEELLLLFNKSDLPHPAGAKDMLRFWGDPIPSPSAATEAIIQQVKILPKKEKLNIVTLGALTNVASAVLMDPTIIPKIRVYSMIGKYEIKTRVWDKNEFNARNDLDAFDILLNTPDLEMHIMTATTSRQLVFTKNEVDKYLKGKKGPWDFLVNKWEERFPEFDTWVMWDVALIEALIDPDLVKEEQLLAPPENLQKTVKVYTGLNKEMMIADYWAAVNSHLRSEKNNKD